jgi:hypothetical protein
MKNSQLALVNGDALTEADVMSAIDLVIEELNRSDNDSKVAQVVNIMDKIGQVTGLAKAKLLWGWHDWYSRTKQEAVRGDEFEDMVEAETGTKAITAERYIRTWGYIQDCVIPKEVQSRRMDDLVKISTALSQGYDFTKDQWNKLAKAANSSEVGEIIRNVKGKAPRKSGITLSIDSKGTITVWQNNVPYFVGYLEIKSEDEPVKKAIRRIIDNSQIQEK